MWCKIWRNGLKNIYSKGRPKLMMFPRMFIRKRSKAKLKMISNTVIPYDIESNEAAQGKKKKIQRGNSYHCSFDSHATKGSHDLLWGPNYPKSPSLPLKRVSITLLAGVKIRISRTEEKKCIISSWKLHVEIFFFPKKLKNFAQILRKKIYSLF